MAIWPYDLFRFFLNDNVAGVQLLYYSEFSSV
jgi:hypothetical protein